MARATGRNDLLTPLDALLPELEKLYTDLHRRVGRLLALALGMRL